MKLIHSCLGIGLAATLTVASTVNAGDNKDDKRGASPVPASTTTSPFGAPFGAAGSTNKGISPAQMEEFMKKVMETSAKIEEAKKQIDERVSTLYKTNPTLTASYAKMVELQKQINTLMDADAEMTAMKTKRDILWSVMPSLPKNPGMPGFGAPGMAPGMMPPPNARPAGR